MKRKRRTSFELYHLLKPFLATTTCYKTARDPACVGRKVEFVPEERRPSKCWLPVKWVPPHKKLWREWCRLSYDQFCRAYDLPLEC